MITVSPRVPSDGSDFHTYTVPSAVHAVAVLVRVPNVFVLLWRSTWVYVPRSSAVVGLMVVTWVLGKV